MSRRLCERGPLVTHACAIMIVSWDHIAIYAGVLRTDDELGLAKALVCHCMSLGGGQHNADTLTRSLLRELHLQQSIVDGSVRNLPAEVIQFAMRDLEVGCRVFVLLRP
jgi:hypothetical protein